jgi:hypothetical protein
MHFSLSIATLEGDLMDMLMQSLFQVWATATIFGMKNQRKLLSHRFQLTLLGDIDINNQVVITCTMSYHFPMLGWQHA